MGEAITFHKGDSKELSLNFVPQSEFQRISSESPTSNLELFTTLCRINILYMIQRAGSGHIGTSFSSLDLIAYLYLRHFDQIRDRNPIFFSSKGHDAPARYAVLTALGRLPFDLIHRFRRLDGLPGHPDIGTSFMHTNTGSLGMGISKARGMILANLLQGKTEDIFVMFGDGEMQEGQVWESLQPTTNRSLGSITVILDHNKLQSDTFVDRVSSLGELQKKLEAFGWFVRRIDGHRFSAMAEVFDEMDRIRTQPKFLIADTIKGKGVSFTEHTKLAPSDRLYRFHSGALSPELFPKAHGELVAEANSILSKAGLAPLALEETRFEPPQAPKDPHRMVGAYGKALAEEGQANSKIVVLDGDLALDTGVLEFEKRFPDRFIECGIAEQDMVSQAGGLALKGMLPIVHSFACFLTTRANEQIFNNATERKKIIYVGSLAGFLPGGPGHSHQSVRDIGILKGLPNLIMLEPASEKEAALALHFLLNECAESGYLRLVSIPCALPYQVPENLKLQLGCGSVLREGKDAVVIGYGPILLSEAVRAADELSKNGIQISVVNLPWLNRVNPDWLLKTCEPYSTIITLDNHMADSGQGIFLSSRLAELGALSGKKIVNWGLTETPKCGWNSEVLEAHELSASRIAKRIRGLLNREHS